MLAVTVNIQSFIKIMESTFYVYVIDDLLSFNNFVSELYVAATHNEVNKYIVTLLCCSYNFSWFTILIFFFVV